jgi:hypothetical protein
VQTGALQTNEGAQSAGSAQLTLQAVLPSQAYGEQLVTWGAHGPPAPGQVSTVSIDDAQVVAPHGVPAGWVAQWPAPSQVPVVPQVMASIAAQSPAGSSPAGTAWQVPCLLVTAQELQLPQLAAAQQKPSVQLPLKHSVPDRQAAPLAFRLVQVLAMQVKPAAQSPSPLHDVRQDVGPQAKGAQPIGG